MHLQGGLDFVLGLDLHDVCREGANQQADDDADCDEKQGVEEDGEGLIAGRSDDGLYSEEGIGGDDQGSTGGLSERAEEVGRHTSHITYVVTYVIGNGGRVLGGVLRQVLLDFSHQIGTHIGSLGINTTAHSSEQGHERSSQTVSGNGFEEFLVVVTPGGEGLEFSSVVDGFVDEDKYSED